MLRSALPIDRVEAYASRDAWLAARGGTDRTRIGASEVASILGLPDAFRNPWDVWTEKTGALERKADPAAEEWLTLGQMLEPIVLFQYSRRTGRPVVSPGDAVGRPGAIVIVRHAVESWAVCSPDAVTQDAFATGLVEAKTDDLGGGWATADMTLERADDYTPDLAPAPYVVQAFWQIECSGLPFVDLACRLPRHTFRVIRILPDPAYQAQILDQVGEWRERHLVRGDAPEVDASETCRRYLTSRHPGAGKETREATVEEAEIAREIARVKAERGDLEAREALLSNRLAATVGDAYGVTLPSGARALLVPTRGRESVRLAELRTQRPDLYTQLDAAGFVSRGDPTRQLRLYGF